MLSDWRNGQSVKHFICKSWNLRTYVKLSDLVADILNSKEAEFQVNRSYLKGSIFHS